jgi:hypothetical protein
MKTRFLHAIYGLLAAWGAGLLSTTGEQVALCWRNADKDIHIFWHLIPLVMLIWAAWTFCISLVGWSLIALPLALLVDGRWIHHRRRGFMVACAFVSIAFTTFYFQAWRLFQHTQIDRANYRLYTIFTVSYSVAMAAMYTWLAGRSIPATKTIELTRR